MNETIQYPFKNDHDVFIALIEDFTHSIKEVNHKISDDHTTTLEVKALLEKQYETLSARIDELEGVLQEIRPEDIAKLKEDVVESTQWIRDFKRTRHFIWIAASTGFILFGYYMPNLILTISKLFFGHK